jgi:hypothetical protein
MTVRGRPLACVLVLALGCAARTMPTDPGRERFRFPADAFAFANETVWEYAAGAGPGGSWRRREPRPAFSLRCGTMTRAARQFYAGARFDPSRPPVDAGAYERLVREVLRGDPRRPARSRVVIPGYPDLRSFSAAHESLVKAAIAGPWQSYLQRGNWRMIFPFTARHQRRLERRMLDALGRGWPPIVHVVRYPELLRHPHVAINHLVMVYDAEETPAEIRFLAYDPNDAAHPVTLTFDRAARSFAYSATPYFAGGPLKVYEVYAGFLY